MDFSVFKLQSVSDLFHIFNRDVLIQPYMVDLLLLERRMCQLGSQITIVSQQQDTCRVTVQTAHRINSFLASVLNQIHDSQTFLRIIGCCHTVLRLIQNNIHFALDLNLLVLEQHPVLTGNLRSQFGYNLIIYLDNTCLDKFIRLATRTNACIRQELIQADRFVRISQHFLILQLFLEVILGIRIVITSTAIVVRTSVVIVAATSAAISITVVVITV